MGGREACGKAGGEASHAGLGQGSVCYLFPFSSLMSLGKLGQRRAPTQEDNCFGKSG